MTSHDGRSRKATRKTKSTKEQKMKSLKFFKPALATHHYLFVALLFASFAVASVSAATQHIQRMIRFDYTTDRILCAFNEQVELHGTIHVSFKRIGNRVRLDSASLENFEGVGLTTRREYVADTVTLQKLNLSQLPPIVSSLLPTGLQIAHLSIPVTGKHPTNLNSATGDPLPGQDVHFQLWYTIGWKSRNGRVTTFIPDFTIAPIIALLAPPVPDGKGVIICN